MLSAILHIGNIEFMKVKRNFDNTRVCTNVCSLTGIIHEATFVMQLSCTSCMIRNSSIQCN